MAYQVSNNYRKVIYSGGAEHNALLTINDNEINNEQISKIELENPMFDNEAKMFYLGQFASNQTTIYFKNMNNIPVEGKINLSIGTKVDGEYEYIPNSQKIIDYNQDDYYKNNKIVCLDEAIKFKPNIDISSFVPCTLEELLHKLGEYYNIEIGTYPNVNKDYVVSTYDNTLSGKFYFSMIAELMGGNLKIGRDNKLYIIPLKHDYAVEIDATASKSWKIESTYTISRVTYDTGSVYCTYGNDTGNTLYIRNDNIFVLDNYEELIENIYNAVVGFTISSVETENYGDPSLDPWDIIKYTLDDQVYYTYNNSVLTYEMNIMSKVKTSIPNKIQESTTNVVESNDKEKIRKMQTTINQQDLKINELYEEIDGTNEKVTEFERGLDGVKISVKEVNDKVDQSLTINNIDSGNPIEVEDAGKYELESIGIDGKSYQEVSTGKNIFILPESQTLNGVTFTNNADGTFDLVGTAPENENVMFYTNVPFEQTGLNRTDRYTCSVRPSIEITTEGVSMGMYFRDANGNPAGRFLEVGYGRLETEQASGRIPTAIKNPASIWFYIQVYKGETIDLHNIELQLEIGTEVTSFEPYTGGVSIPNPNNPSEIKTVQGVTNYLPNNIINQTISGVTIEVDTKGIITCNGTATSEIKLEVGHMKLGANTYRLSGCPSGGDGTTYELQTNNLSPTYRDRGASVVFTLSNETTFWVTLIIRNGCTVNDLVFKPMITLANKNYNRYVPYGRWIEQIAKDKDGNISGALIDMNKPSLFNEEDATEGYRLDSNGNLYSDSSYFTSDFIEIKTNERYFVLNMEVTQYKRIVIYDKDKNYIKSVSLIDNIITDSNSKYLRFSESITNKDIVKLYEGHGSYYELAEVDDAKDKFLDGELVKNITKYVFTGDEVCNKVTEGFYVKTPSWGNQNHSKTLSTHFPTFTKYSNGLREVGNGGGFLYDNINQYYIKIEGITTSDEMQAYLKTQYEAGNPVIVYYVLAEPQTYELPYERLKLHKGYNYITLNDELYPKIHINYLTDSEFNATYLTRTDFRIEKDNITSEVSKKVSINELNMVVEDVKSTIEQTADSITSSVNRKFNNYSTTTEMTTAITQSVNEETAEIKLEVSKKISAVDGGKELASIIRQTSELIYLQSKNFGWKSDYSEMTTDGGLTIKSGDIGGWVINSQGIQRIANNYGVALQSQNADGSTKDTDIIQYIYDYNKNQYNYYLLRNGHLYSRNADIEGTIKSNNGEIGNWNITSNALYKDVRIGNYDYRVYIQSPQTNYNENSWIFSCQKKATSETGYSGTFIATLGGNVSCETLEVRKYLKDRLYLNSGESAWIDTDGLYFSNGAHYSWNNCMTYNMYCNYIYPGGNVGLTLRSGGYFDYEAGDQSIWLSGANNITLNPGNKAWIRVGSGSSHAINTTAGSESSLNLKENIERFNNDDYEKAIDLLRHIDLYSYDYKYNIFDDEKDNKNEFGFIIDYVEENSEADRFFKFVDKKAKITDKNCLDEIYVSEHPNDTEDIIEYKEYDNNTLGKYLLTVCKTQQRELDDLKKEVIELKELIKNEIYRYSD